MTARPIDAAEGYRLYRQHSGGVELDEINEYLRGIGLREVSPRMYLHYQRLARFGYEAYIPINRLDVAVAGDSAWSEDIRARYPEVSQAFPAQIIWRAAVQDATVLALGSATATIETWPIPPAGSPVVLVLQTTEIERTGTIVRADPSSGLTHIAFDPYSSLPVAPTDARYRALLRFELPDDAQNVAAVSDLMLNVDRLMIGVSSDVEDSQLVRLQSLNMQSPLEILLIGGAAVGAAVKLLQIVATLRLTWYQGTREKYEAEGIQLDNEQKRRAVQLEADQELESALANELDEEVETPLLDELSSEALPKGDPSSTRRRKLIDWIRLAIQLPVGFVAEVEDTETDPDGTVG